MGRDEDVCLPFWLVDGDDVAAVRLVSVPVVMPPDWLAALLLLATPPDEVPDRVAPDAAWQQCAEFLLLAGMEYLAARLPAVRQAANTDPDTFLRFAQCRRQVDALFTGPVDLVGPDDPEDPAGPARWPGRPW